MSKHLINFSNLFYRLTPIQLRTAAFEFAKKNNIKYNFKKQLHLASIRVDWSYKFVRRNPIVTVRKPEARSICGITAFNKIEENLFSQIWNN